MKTVIRLLIGLTFLYLSDVQAKPQTGSATKAHQALEKSVLVASLELESKNSTTSYQLFENKGEAKDTFIRKEGSSKSKSIQVPKGLSAKIKNDLLGFAWDLQYKDKTPKASKCEEEMRIQVRPDDQASVCSYQRLSWGKARSLEKNLKALF